MEFIQKILELFDPFSSIAKYTGLGGLAIALVLFVLKEIIKKSNFSKFNKIESYNVIRLIIRSCSLIAIVALLIYAAVEIDRGKYKSDQFIEKDTLHYEKLILKDKGIKLPDSTTDKK